jgi:hypothetical protein
MTRERLIELYEVEIRQAFDNLGDDFDLCRDDIDFTHEGAKISVSQTNAIRKSTKTNRDLGGVSWKLKK